MHASHVEGMRNAYEIVIGKPEGNRYSKRPRHRWEEDIKLISVYSRLIVWIKFIWLRIGTGGGLL
jgi:hypothetical protein